jgi:nucleoside phosphorylase
VPKILVTFALRQEGVSFERRLDQRTAADGLIAGRIDSCEVGITWLGMRMCDDKQFEGIIAAKFPPDIVINSGFAGAVRTLLEPGDFLLAENFSSPGVVSRLRTERIFDASGVFECLDEVAEPPKKMRINAGGNIVAVDMESARFAAICTKHSVPFVTARMVSDRYDEMIPKIFLGKGMARTKDISDAIWFASRMIQLRRRLADRLTALIDAVSG